MSSGASTDQDLSPDLIFDLLSSPRRRMALYYLREHGGSSTVTELAEEIASLEYDIPAEELSRQQRKRVYVSLYQTHVPKLAEAGVIEYDEDTSEVQLTDRARRMDSYLTTDDTGGYPWHYHYLGLALASGGLLLLAVFTDLGPLGPLAVGIAVTVAFAISGVAQLLYRRYRDRPTPEEISERSFR
ncbi:DUF7344 domain-containing protein [Haloglomus litoreum]|uniref:DUF7344 domain-containing protein n=1 Tax=Haloglomus litoreum TaxID=3034026 RepID=UPI0023E886A6|nr:hypothetical protein [Haloglomus sp. DT116]